MTKDKIEQKLNEIKKTINRQKENNIKAKEKFSTREVIGIVIITILISMAFFLLLFYDSSKINDKMPENEDLAIKEIIEQYNYIKENFYQNIDENLLINGAIKGMTEALGDEYSEVIDESDFDTYNIILEGEYYGVGIQIANAKDSKIVVTAVFEDAPAGRAGIEVGDIITKIDGESLEGRTAKSLGDAIKTGKGKTYVLTVERQGEEKNYSVTTEKVELTSIVYETLEQNNQKIGYIYISVFANNTDEQFKNALANLETEGIDGLIIDVRDNTGGHLTTLTNILSVLVDKSNIIYQTEDKDGKVELTYSTGKVTKEYPIVVLGNGYSASASELLISGLMDTIGAKFVGETTFGKGSVQELKTLSTGEQYKITTKKWLTPKGNSINGVGITPDYEIKLSDEYYNNPSNETDNQLQKAINLLDQ